MRLLLQMFPEMNDLSNGDYLDFQQDGARSHTAAYTLNYLQENMSATAELVVPEDWQPNSHDFNPMDYGIWSILANSVFSVKIRDLNDLGDRLARAWDALPLAQIPNTTISFRKHARACIAAEGKRFKCKL